MVSPSVAGDQRDQLPGPVDEGEAGPPRVADPGAEQVEGGRDQPAVELAQTIIDTQQQEIDTMRDLLTSL